ETEALCKQGGGTVPADEPDVIVRVVFVAAVRGTDGVEWEKTYDWLVPVKGKLVPAPSSDDFARRALRAKLDNPGGDDWKADRRRELARRFPALPDEGAHVRPISLAFSDRLLDASRDCSGT